MFREERKDLNCEVLVNKGQEITSTDVANALNLLNFLYKFSNFDWASSKIFFNLKKSIKNSCTTDYNNWSKIKKLKKIVKLTTTIFLIQSMKNIICFLSLFCLNQFSFRENHKNKGQPNTVESKITYISTYVQREILCSHRENVVSNRGAIIFGTPCTAQ